MSLHIVHFIGPINATSACTIRNLCPAGAAKRLMRMTSVPISPAARAPTRQAVEAGLVHAARQAHLPDAGGTSHWCN
jgi:hypothetical protein